MSIIVCNLCAAHNFKVLMSPLFLAGFEGRVGPAPGMIEIICHLKSCPGPSRVRLREIFCTKKFYCAVASIFNLEHKIS